MATELIQSRIASLIASRSVREPLDDRPHLGPEQLHAEHIRLLAADVFLAHVDDALQAEAGTGRGGGDAVLPGAGFGDHAPLAHPHGEQGLAERVVDLMGAGVVQVFALQIDLGAAVFLAQPLGVIQRRRPADIMPQQIAQFGLKLSIGMDLLVLHGQIVERADQRFRHIAAAIVAKAADSVGHLSRGGINRGIGSWGHFSSGRKPRVSSRFFGWAFSVSLAESNVNWDDRLSLIDRAEPDHCHALPAPSPFT